MKAKQNSSYVTICDSFEDNVKFTTEIADLMIYKNSYKCVPVILRKLTKNVSVFLDVEID